MQQTMKTLTACALWALALGACSDEPTTTADASPVTDGLVQPDTAPAAIIDIRADTNRDGVVSLTDPTEDAGEDSWDAKHGAVFLANMDDDDRSCPKVSDALSDDELAKCHDAADEKIDGAKDLLDLARLKVAPWPAAPEGATGAIVLSLPGAPKGDPRVHVRLFVNRGSFKVLGKADKLTVADLRKGVELALEGRDIVRDRRTWDGYVDISLKVDYTGADNKPATGSDTVRMRVAPLIINHHLQPLDTLYTASTSEKASVDFRADLSKAMAATKSGKLMQIPMYDQWTQDLFETGWMAMPAAGGKQHVITVFLRSANVDLPMSPLAPLRAGGRLVFQVRGPDIAAVQQYDRKHALSMDTLNSLGNLEVIPPHSHGGTSYPLGRIVMGNVPAFYPTKSFTTLLSSQAVQAPLWIDTSWLYVAHTDETMSFIKTSSKRGWALVLNDATLARKMLQDASKAGHGSVTLFEGKYWVDDNNKEYSAQTTVDKVLADTDVMADSAKAAVEVASQLALLKKETGITDAEIIRLPFLHLAVDGYSVAYQPGTVNGTVIGDGHFASPAPHGPIIGGVDIFKQQMTKALAKHGYTVHYVENWDLYHRLLGEVHCGTNALRTAPASRWWEAGR